MSPDGYLRVLLRETETLCSWRGYAKNKDSLNRDEAEDAAELSVDRHLPIKIQEIELKHDIERGLVFQMRPKEKRLGPVAWYKKAPRVARREISIGNVALCVGSLKRAIQRHKCIDATASAVVPPLAPLLSLSLARSLALFLSLM